jgi:hypothetical protein
MDAPLNRLVWTRANSQCEYCRIHQDHDVMTFEIDHIIARKHGGATTSSNLALSCFFCNAHKGPNIAGIDPSTRRITRLDHPRRHRWPVHSTWDGPRLIGRTAIGRTTIKVLEINDPYRIQLRESLQSEHKHPRI